MGYTSALAMNEEFGCNESTMQWHLQSNHYPPHPSYMIPFALKAVKYAKQGKWETSLRVPGGATFRGRKTCKVYEAVESLPLDGFLGNCDQDEPEMEG